MKDLKDNTIWITGASSGIGEALAIQLSVMGVNLILSARRTVELERVRALCASPEKVKILPLDLTDLDSHGEKTTEAISLFGQVDHLINNGGRSQRSLVKDTILQVDRDLMEVNYFGSVSLTKQLLPHMLKRGSGHFTIITSLTGVFGTPYRSGYAASKHALHGFYDSMRAELEDVGIKVTIAAPGFVKTNVSINAFQGDGQALGQMDDAQANGLTPDECAKAIIKAIRKQKREVYIGKESYAAYVKRYLPWLFARLIKKAKVR
ncbi:SDR family oxidoreductase [Roseivirga misakiensis]|uniref:Short-chain dehydrogenase n=1 Tax=Roseivirga misakiensis TaxID=1563681 RepID=A0A1E5SKZ6_9BACT|nr:SDR family oxidoreductase [Roseivirga misakiensis]OEJ99763.1 short-chain dehydrogenase [Roseivirga misakiensis]